MPLPKLFEPTLFDPVHLKWNAMEFPSRFIRPIHPKTMIAPDATSIGKVVALGWWGQPKIHGHRAQIHIPADPQQACLVYNRQGQLHREVLSESAERELRRLFQPSKDWNTIDAEWLKPKAMIYVFDYLKFEGRILDDLSFAERYEMLPKLYVSPHVTTLPVFKTVEKCVDYLAGDLPPFIEGLVFRAAHSEGFADSTIVRCRLPGQG